MCDTGQLSLEHIIAWMSIEGYIPQKTYYWEGVSKSPGPLYFWNGKLQPLHHTAKVEIAPGWGLHLSEKLRTTWDQMHHLRELYEEIIRCEN